MIGYDPGQGWRPADQQDDVRDCIAYWDAKTRTWSRWVRDVPVPPLPTAPYTVIRVTSTSSMESILIRNELGWYEIDDMSAPVEQPLTGWSFEVLAEPRAVTAKAVLDRLAEITAPENILTGGAYHDIAREFGAES